MNHTVIIVGFMIGMGSTILGAVLDIKNKVNGDYKAVFYFAVGCIGWSISGVMLMYGINYDKLNHTCPPHPLPSVPHVQRELNKVIDPALFQPLEVDGVAADKTVAAWMFYSPGFEAENQKRRTE